MAIYMAGVDHRKADLDVRSVFSFTPNQKEQAYEILKADPEINGALLIATCNRTELWIHASKHGPVSPEQKLFSVLDVPEEEYRGYITERSGDEAVDHLFRLSAGLESKIIGEGQILTQVGDALSQARSFFATDNTLEVLFRQAVTAGKRVRTETDLSTADRSVIHTALDLMKEGGFDPAGKKCLVIGNGMMGRLSAGVLLEKGAVVTMTVRKYHRGIVEVPSGCATIGYEERYRFLPCCDLVVSATSSPNYTLLKEELSRLEAVRPVSVLDLAVPRDVEPGAGELPWIDLYDIDSFRIDLQSDKFKWNLEKALQIIEEEKAEFYSWYKGGGYMSLISKLKEKTGRDVAARMAPSLKKYPLDNEQKKKIADDIAAASERMMNHVFFSLKHDMSEEAFRELMIAMEKAVSTIRKKGEKHGSAVPPEEASHK